MADTSKRPAPDDAHLDPDPIDDLVDVIEVGTQPSDDHAPKATP